jgi:predicted dehydrogenase
MIRVGFLDFGTSHVVEFTRRLNHIDISEDQWVEGAKVVAGVPGESKITPKRVGPFAEQMKKYGIPLYSDPADLFSKVDAVIIESGDGSVHRQRALPFIEKGITTFVDKPLASSLADAKAIVEAAQRKHTTLFSSSSLRYAPEVVAVRGRAKETGDIKGVTTYGPAPLDATGRNPGLFHYGIHEVEMLYALMGPGCQRLTCLRQPGGEVVTGLWSDGRIGSARGIRDGRPDYGFTLFGTRRVVNQEIGTGLGSLYRELLKVLVKIFETRQVPFDLHETLEIIAFLEAAQRSALSTGEPQDVKV